MRLLSTRILALTAVLAALPCCARPTDKSKAPPVRPPAVAGSFYPARAEELRKMVDGFLASAPAPASQDTLLGLVSPHAGYPFSGPVAGRSYALLKGRKYSRVVVVAPSHYDAFSFSSIYDGDAYSTPLGNIPVDKDFAAKLAAQSPLIKVSSRGHAVNGQQKEHALEVQLPFLQQTLGQFTLVPIVMGDQSYAIVRALGVALARLAANTDTLLVASSDLSHFHTYEEASRLDRNTLRALGEWDYFSMHRSFETRVWEACGGGPIIAVMMAAERLGANQAQVLKYANSGDATGDRSRVVGYGAAAFYKQAGAKAAAGPAFSLGAEEKAELLRIAHASVEAAVKQHKLYDCPVPKYEALLADRGAFVTLKEKGDLRGCIGYSSPLKPLYLTVRDVAAYAAVKDTRFSPVSAAELGQLEFEISVLSPVRRVLDPRTIEIGKHGLIMKKGETEGLLLPQVPVEQHWDRAAFLENTCMKAGLPTTAWKDPEADLFEFSALVFH